MKVDKQKIKAFLSIFYILILVFTNISFVGFWTDIIVAILLLISFLWKATYKSLIFIIVTIVVSIVMLVFLNPFVFDNFKMRSFYFQKVNGRLFNAYFKPVGAYSGGYGNFWITESPKYFPFIEKEIYYHRTFDYNLNDDTFDGQPIDNYKVVKGYIQREVIEGNR